MGPASLIEFSKYARAKIARLGCTLAYYYLAGDGALCTSQWVEDDGKAYYMTRTGLMATSCYVRSEMPYKPGKWMYYWVGEDGAWIPKWDTDEPDLRRYYCAT